MSPEIQTFLLAMSPFGELRASLLLALVYFQLNWLLAFLISVAGNLIPVIILLRFLPFVSDWLSRNFRPFQSFFSWLFKRTRRRYNSEMEKYGYPALFFFVAIPLPLTGGWTGSLIAFLFGIPFKNALSLIGAGIITAGLLVLLLTQTGIIIGRYFGWQVLFGVLLIIGFSWLIYEKNRRHN